MKTHKKLSIERKRALFGYVFTLPWILGFLIFMLYPLIISAMLSVSKIVNLEGLNLQYIGFVNFKELFTTNIYFVPSFLDTIANTFIWLPFILVFAIFIAQLLDQKIKFRGFFRAIYFLPVLLGSGFVIKQLGEASNILSLPTEVSNLINYYISPDIATFVQQLLNQIMNVFWKTGVQIVIFLAGLQSIPDTYYEAAKVDNANSWQIFWKITLPILTPTILLNTVYTVIDSFRDMNNKIANLIVTEVFNNTQFESGSAMGWIYFIVIFIFIGLVLLLFRSKVHYE